MAEDRCICCGEIIPEGMMVCPKCQVSVGHGKSVSNVRAITFNKPTEWGRRFHFPENETFEIDGLVIKTTTNLIAQMVDDYEDYVVEHIAKTARENGISDLTVLNKRMILSAIQKQSAQKPVDVSKSELYGRCAVCGQVVHIGNRYCDQCGQKIDWGEEDDQ